MADVSLVLRPIWLYETDGENTHHKMAHYRYEIVDTNAIRYPKVGL